MGENPRYTFYMPQMEAMKKAAKEDFEDMNGALIEQLFWYYHAGGNVAIQDIIKRLYQEEYTLREALVLLVRYIMYSDVKKEMYFDALPRIARDACISSEWQKEGNIYFFVEQKETCRKLYDVLEKDYEIEIQENDFFQELVEEGDEVISWSDNGDLSDEYSYEDKETIENYLYLTQMKNKAKQMFESENATPADYLNFIIENWNCCFEKPETYVVIEFCVSKSLNMDDNAILRKRLREFSRLFSRLTDYSERKIYLALEFKKHPWDDKALSYIEE